jgi:hypothetical protein
MGAGFELGFHGRDIPSVNQTSPKITPPDLRERFDSLFLRIKLDCRPTPIYRSSRAWNIRSDVRASKSSSETMPVGSTGPRHCRGMQVPRRAALTLALNGRTKKDLIKRHATKNLCTR